jgi:hypothetical protein
LFSISQKRKGAKKIQRRQIEEIEKSPSKEDAAGSSPTNHDMTGGIEA